MKKYIFHISILILSFLPAKLLQAQENEVLDIDAMLQIDEHKQAKIDAAFALMDQVQKAGAYIESISELLTNGAITLPVGIKQGEYELIIQRIKYDSEFEKFQIYATCAFQFKEDGQRIAFEGMADIEGQKGLGTNGYLELIAPIKRDMGNQATLVVMNGTKVNFGCEGIESFDADLGLLITSENIVAVDHNGKETGKPISTRFTTEFANFDQFTASFTIDQSFMFKGLDDMIFTLKGAVIDQDDLSTPASVQFPENYFAGTDGLELKLWRGVAISEASVGLPKALKKTQESGGFSDERITLALKKVLIDNNGFSAFVEANNVLHSDALPKDQWGMSIEDIALNIEKNTVKGFGFGGDLNVPPFGKNSLTPYSALYNTSTKEYVFTAGLGGSYDFPVFRAKLELLETSTLEILIKDSDIYPTICANGKISIDAPINQEDSTKKFSLPDVNFEQLKIMRDDPYVEIGTIGVSGSIQTPEIAGFGLQIDSIKSFTNDKGSGLRFKAGIKINEMFQGAAGLQLYGNYKQCKFDRINIDEAYLKYEANAFKIEGSVAFKNGDALYGTGFRGDIALTLLKDINIDAIGVFGKVNNYRYFLTDVFMEVKPSAGIKVGPLNFYGFGGGFYRHMQQSTLASGSNFGEALSGINYVPDKTVSMGFMSATKFGLVGTESAFNANVSFEMQFNQYNGLNFVQLKGDGAFMAAPDKLGGLTDQINQKVKAIERASGKLALAVKNDLGVPKAGSATMLTASMNFKYDVDNKTFTADLASYLNAGLIKGTGENGRMGFAAGHVSPGKWYMHLGTPTDRLGVEMLGIKTTSYFMIGDDIPGLPLPPDKVYSKLSADKKQKLLERGTGDMANGKGIAFGQSLELGFNAKLFPFYASLDVELGGEFSLIKSPEGASCGGNGQSFGVNNWYAKGQAWAYVGAEIGMEARLFGKVRSFDILSLTSGILLEAEGPNPFYFAGSVFGSYSVMGGLISGDCNFDFDYGEQCIEKGGSPFGENVIASLTPSDGDKDINVFTAPQMVLNIPADFEMRIQDDDGSYGTYQIKIKEFTAQYKTTKQKINGYYELSSDHKTYLLDPDEPLESQKQIELIGKVTFQKKNGNTWEDVKDANGNVLTEEMSYSFTSGDRPKTIMPQHVKYSYPIDRQFNFYPDEYETGYFMITENYAYLFEEDKPQGFDQIVRVSAGDQVLKDVDFTYKKFGGGNEIRLEVEFNMSSIAYANNSIYNMALINKPQQTASKVNSNVKSKTKTESIDGTEITITTQEAEGNKEVLEVKEIYGLDFRISDFNTLQAKMDEINPRGNGWRLYLEPGVHDIKSNVYVDEGLDKFEYGPTSPLIKIQADLANTSWYNGSVYEDMYTIVDKSKISRSFNIEKLGYPPVYGVEFRNVQKTKLLEDDEIATGSSSFDAGSGNITYSIPYWISKDYGLIQEYLANKKVNGLNLSSKEENIIVTPARHQVTKGEYPIFIKYVLPGKDHVCSSVYKPMYNPIN